MNKENDKLLNCWYNIWNKVNTNRLSQSDVLKKFEFIEHILKGHNVDTTKYSYLELIGFIYNITSSVNIKCDYSIINRIVNCINCRYQDVDTINTTEDVPNTPKEAQKELIETLRFIFDSSDATKIVIFGTSEYYDILKLDSDEIITKYNNYIKSTNYRIGDEIYIKTNPDERYWITKIYVYDFDCLSDDGSVRCVSKTSVKKTGRHNQSLSAILHANMEGCIIIEDDKND